MSWIKWIVKNKKENKVAKKKTRRKNKYLKIGNFKIKKKVAIIVICVLVAVVAFILFRTSYLWPWPSQFEIDQRLVDVIDGCMYNEDSRACKSLQSRYNMDFEYCYALSDIPEIDTLMPIYGVAKKKGFVGNTLTWESRHKLIGYSSNENDLERNLKRAEQEKDIYPYYGCTGSLDQIKNQSGKNLIAEPETIALFGLSKVPEYLATGDINGCSAYWGSFNNLWNQIPNAQKIKNEGDNIRNIYNKCGMIADAKVAANGLNDRLRAYANNYSVQLFYQKYDEWNNAEWSGMTCTWYDKEFKQYCGAAINNQSEVTGHNASSMLKDFTEEMQQYLHTEYFTSKIVVSD